MQIPGQNEQTNAPAPPVYLRKTANRIVPKLSCVCDRFTKEKTEIAPPAGRKLMSCSTVYENQRLVVERLFKTEIRFWDLLGGKMAFDTALFTHVLFHKRTMVFMALCVVTFFAADPSGARSYVPMWFSVIIWPIALVLYLCLYHAVLLGAAALVRSLPRLRIPSPLLSLIALCPTVALCETAADIASNGNYPQDVLSQLNFYFLAVQGLETVFFKFIMPGVRAEIRTATVARHLVVGGEKIDLRDLHHIEAREHHVHLTLTDTRKLFRARLSDLVAQTQPEDGIQPHRSWWVARDQVVTPERSNGRMTLRLRDDTVVPVARTRLGDVQDWISRHLDQPM